MTRPAADLVLGERYRLVEPIATGGMGTVWRAHDETLDRTVAVKVLNEDVASDRRFVERFRREARAAAGLSHPNICAVFDYGENGRPYIVMELLEGQTLAERLAAAGPLPAEEAARVAAEIADALAEAHAAGVVHRDVKPGNVMITARGSTKVMDFGIAATATQATLTGTGMVMGTARYLAPEQARGEKATPASDVYALGVVLYEMLAGRPPFERESAVATAMAHARDEPPPLAAARPDVPEGLVAVVDAALAKDPAKRPRSAAAMAEVLRSAAAGGPTAPLAGAAAGEATVPLAAGDPTPTRPIVEPEPPASSAGAAGGVFPGGRRGGRRRGRLWMILLPLAVLLAVTAAVIAASRSAQRVEPFELPQFTGRDAAVAASAAEELGLDVRLEDREADAAEGTVIAQRPRPGTEVLPGSDLVLVVSTGPTLVEVPALDAVASEEQLMETLAAAGLEFGGYESVEGERGIVGTRPPAGERVPEGSSVVVLIGTGDGDGDGDEGDGDGDGGNSGPGGGGSGKGNKGKGKGDD